MVILLVAPFVEIVRQWTDMARLYGGARGSLGGSSAGTPTQPDTSRNRPAGAPLRPPVIDGIEEHDPAGRIEQLA